MEPMMTESCSSGELVVQPGTRVQLIHDLARIGVLTGQVRSRGRRRLLQVQFPDGARWKPESQLRPVPDQLPPIDWLRKKKLGRPHDLRRTLTHVKLSGRLEDMIYSMEVTNTDFYAFQFKPVVKILDSPSNRILIADEVGLGKTIEAGLIWTELRSRFDMRRLLVLCPAALREKWRFELSSKFGVDAEICDARKTLKTLADGPSHSRGFAIVASLQGLRPPRGWQDRDAKKGRTPAAELARFLRDNQHDRRLIDLLVIDEAHHLRNPKTKTHALGRLTRNVAEYAAFLTATPIHNRSDDLHALLRLLDPANFADRRAFTRILDANGPLVEARDLVLSRCWDPRELRDILTQAGTHSLLRNNRQLRQILDRDMIETATNDLEARSVLAYSLETVNLLAHVFTRTRKRDVKEKRVVRDPKALLVDLHPAEREFYQLVTDEVIEYALKHKTNEPFLLAQPQRQMTSSMAAALRSWQSRHVDIDDSAEVEGPDGRSRRRRKKLGRLVKHIVTRASPGVDFADLERHDSKYAELRRYLKMLFAEHPNDKVIVFSTFRATLQYLFERLTRDAVDCFIIMGGQREPKADVIDRFRASPGPCVLLSSEVGGEGVDLQFSWVVVNYDLPWNPMRIEQRIGRIDRLGQESPKVRIVNILYDDTIDSRIYTGLYEKLDLCQRALGDFESILGETIRKLEGELISKRLTPEEQNRRIDEAAQALENKRLHEEQLEEEAAGLTAYGDYILNHVREVRKLHRWITGDDLVRYVSDYLSQHYPRSYLRQFGADRCLLGVHLSAKARWDLERYVRKNQLRYVGFLTSPSGRRVRCRFDNSVVQLAGTRREEVISQFHPLVRMARSDIGQEAEITPAVAGRVAHRHVGAPVECGVYVVAVSRWFFGGLQKTVRLAYAAARLDCDGARVEPDVAERIASATVRRGSEWLEARNNVELEAARRMAMTLFDALEDEFHDHAKRVSARNEDRADIQRRNLREDCDRRKAVLLATLQRLQELGRRPSLVKAIEGQIRALENRVKQEERRIDERRQMVSELDEVALAIVSIESD